MAEPTSSSGSGLAGGGGALGLALGGMISHVKVALQATDLVPFGIALVALVTGQVYFIRWNVAYW